MVKKVPAFANEEEERTFWDEHDVTEYAEGWRRRNAPNGPASTFSLRLEKTTVEQIRKLARIEGLGPTQLVRRWIHERLRLEREAGRLAKPSGRLKKGAESELRSHVVNSLLYRASKLVNEAVDEAIVGLQGEMSGEARSEERQVP